MKKRLSQKLAYLLAVFSIMIYLTAPRQEMIPVTQHPEYEQNLMIMLLDEDELLIPLTLSIEEPLEIMDAMKQVIEWMSQSFPFESFESILPEKCTLLDVKIENSHADLIFNDELLNYPPENEKKIVEALSWIMTQFDSISSISLWIKDEPLLTLPYKNTKAVYLTPTIGINNFQTSKSELHETIPVHLVYDKPMNEKIYKVILSKRIDDQSNFEVVEQVVFHEVMEQLPYHERFKMTQSGNIEDGVFHLYLDEAALLDESTLDLDRLENLLYSYYYTFDLERFIIHIGDRILPYENNEIIDVSQWIINESLF